MENLVMMESNFWKNKKVLITGHTGFKGSWLLIYLLLNGAKVYGYSLPPVKSRNLFSDIYREIKDKFIHHEGNILDFELLKSLVKESQPDVVIHLAAQALVRESYNDPIGTWNTNLIGSINLLESLKDLKKRCAVLVITTDKVYENKEWSYGYRETDPLGGHDPYSASKAALEIALASWRSSFCGSKLHQNSFISIASARAGNVIGGGDWSENRIIPDSIKALTKEQTIKIRNISSTRPWQHVLDPLSGYLLLSQRLYENPNEFSEAFNFGPSFKSNKTVLDLVKEVLKYWEGNWDALEDNNSPHEASNLSLQIDKSNLKLGFQPKWDFVESVKYTTLWYYNVSKGEDPYKSCINDLNSYCKIN